MVSLGEAQLEAIEEALGEALAETHRLQTSEHAVACRVVEVLTQINRTGRRCCNWLKTRHPLRPVAARESP